MQICTASYLSAILDLLSKQKKNFKQCRFDRSIVIIINKLMFTYDKLKFRAGPWDFLAAGSKSFLKG